jgi:hypothetical protein
LASLGLNLDEQKAVERFQKDVVAPSRDKRGNPIPTAQNALVIIGGPVESHNQER